MNEYRFDLSFDVSKSSFNTLYSHHYWNILNFVEHPNIQNRINRFIFMCGNILLL